MTSKTVPGGRGKLLGLDSRVLRARDLDARSKLKVHEEQLYISPFDIYGCDVTATTGHQAELSLVMLPPLRDVFSPTHARCRITTYRTLQWVTCAIYRFSFRDHGGGGRYTKVPGTDALFPTESNGVQTVEVRAVGSTTEPTLLPGERYFIGSFVSNTGIGLASDANTTARIFPVITMPMPSATSTIPYIPFGSVTREYDNNIPWLVYLSRVGSKLL